MDTGMRGLMLAVVIGLAVPLSALAVDGDPKAGKKTFSGCKACHQVGAKVKIRIGPVLNGIVGRNFGVVDGFKYSSGLKAMAEAGSVWDAQTLDTFLMNPKKFIPKTRMAFPGIKDAGKRADVIAYLAQFDRDGKTK
jgi:cytochrome c